MIKFGNSGDSRNTLCDDINLIWTNKFTSLGIDYDSMELDKIIETKIIRNQKIYVQCGNLEISV